MKTLTSAKSSAEYKEPTSESARAREKKKNDKMAAEIERIVDRKLIRNRVHYLVVWRGFGEENNTWYVAVVLYRFPIRDRLSVGRLCC